MGMRAREEIQSYQRWSEQNVDSETRAGERIIRDVNGGYQGGYGDKEWQS